jgi:sugar lactone lactonase YvrE
MALSTRLPRARRILRTALLAAIVLGTSAHGHPGSGILVDRNGNVYFVDTGEGVWKLTPDGRLVRYGGPAFHWMALDADDAFAATGLPRTGNSEMRAAGSGPTVVVSSDYPVVIADGALHWADPGGGRLTLVGVRPDGARREIGRLPGRLEWINGLAAGRDGSFLFTDDRTVHRVASDGRVATVAEVGIPDCMRTPGYRAEHPPALRGLAEAEDGTVWVAATGCGALVKIAPDGVASIALRTEAPWSPTAVTTGPDGVYVLEYSHTASESDDRRLWVPRVRRIAADGSSTVLVTVPRD